jgi:hypothetical protein
MRHTCDWALGDSPMPAYGFEVIWNDRKKVSWTYLPTDNSARNFAQILIRNFKSGGQYCGAARLTVKNDDGTPITTISFYCADATSPRNRNRLDPGSRAGIAARRIG